jgi:ParB-like chromosome segregation protein Spo0J
MPKEQTLAIEWRALNRVLPYENNPRIITDAAISKVAASIKEFGWRQPIVVDEDGVILVGHTRKRAAELLELKKVPVHVARGLSEAQKRAYRIADNRTGEETSWSKDLLKIELGEIAALGFDLAPIGFDLAELPKFTAPAMAPTEFPEVNENIPTAYQCPKCSYRWSGTADAGDEK